ncbi:MAG TPA: NAD(P)-dependent oxidoreductase [Pyrinomonadaceae bacterium]|jgi:nucleoside-diphosphate-sugar epimerase|nr:NAD(P)-dependent oxidoreductase [Pyrinomonadaceae bacterium]
MAQTYFITGAQGCIGSWIVKSLAERGDTPVVFDRSSDSKRLRAIMDDDDLERVRFIAGDITDKTAVRSALESSGAQRVIHLAGLQVPTCKADPVSGAMVNVVGTLNLFEAAKETGTQGVIYASSAAVYGMNDDNTAIDETVECEPSTHYGVFKRTNEGNARIYFLDHGISSIGLRPLTVYGVNRDTGLTSDPTKAMKAAVLGRPFHIRFSGSTDFQYVADTAAAFVACVDQLPLGAFVFNLHGDTVAVSQVANIINQKANGDLVTFSGPEIPIAPTMNDAAIRSVIGGLRATPLADGIEETMKRFALLRDEGRLDTSDLDV